MTESKSQSSTTTNVTNRREQYETVLTDSFNTNVNFDDAFNKYSNTQISIAKGGAKPASMSEPFWSKKLESNIDKFSKYGLYTLIAIASVLLILKFKKK